MNEYFVKLSITLTNKDITVLRQALKGYIYTIDSEACKNTAKDLLELVNHARDTALKNKGSE